MNHITIALCAEDRARLDRLIAALENADTPETEEPDKTEPSLKEEAPEVTEKANTKEEPRVSLAQIQQKVVQLCAAKEGKKKAKARAIVTDYSPTVSGLKDFPEKWDEIWDKLIALEQED